jgi:hypothetical protein
MMSLDIGSSGIFKPYAKYNAKSGRWFIRGSEGKDVEIGLPNFVADLDNIATGWFRFHEKQAPERILDPSIDRRAPVPGEDFKRGFVLPAFSPKFFNGAVEIASASIHLGDAIKQLYEQYKAERAAHPGKLPLVSCTGSEPMRDRYGTNYRPNFKILSWVDRPAELPDIVGAQAANAKQGTSGDGSTPLVAGPQAPPPEPRRSDDPSSEPLF